MTRSLLIILILLFNQLSSFSQSPRFGFDLGLSLNRAAYKTDQEIDTRIFGGFDGGLLVEFTLNKKIILQPELNYTITGVELNDGIAERTIKLQYISIPLLIKVKVLKKLNLIAGPQHGILLSAWNDPSGGVSTRIKEYFKFTDLVLVAGAEYRCPSGLFFALRYNHSIEQEAEEGMGFEMKNRYLTGRIGYIF